MDEEMYEDAVAEAQRQIEEVRLQLLDMSDEATLPFSYQLYTPDYEDVSFESLVQQREKHQTYHAAHSVRTQAGSSDENKDHPQADSDVSIRKRILSAYHDNLRLQGQQRGITTGQGREKRWTSQPTGNALNAAIVLDAAAKKASILTCLV